MRELHEGEAASANKIYKHQIRRYVVAVENTKSKSDVLKNVFFIVTNQCHLIYDLHIRACREFSLIPIPIFLGFSAAERSICSQRMKEFYGGH